VLREPAKISKDVGWPSGVNKHQYFVGTTLGWKAEDPLLNVFDWLEDHVRGWGISVSLSAFGPKGREGDVRKDRCFRG